MSTAPSADARAPQRPRGHLRVAAILEAGAAAFREKGYDAVTMTEIAARSGTAFGSLYRFFPSKEALADALLARYAQRTLDGLAALAEQAPGMTQAALADALVDYMLALHAERSFVVAVMDSHGGRDDKRAQFREAVGGGVASILRRVFPQLNPAKCSAMALALLHILKGAAGAARETPGAGGMLLAEYRDLVRLYLTSV
jgi:AcrR family transcriptional regulator